ncbi:SufD family Fe-S cluster assembly protein [Clostridium sp. D33t1_170424_F3]|uniref:SufB/SufD family protein n=1 Tax=Clostridium sp. D33t1_170424_F3 TaxID=2787099 RepID=UPI0018A89245|nr:SufD family Fe-S cluster assembly protein [Clostridium sp. D33t1_170424_F3]
MDRIAKKLLELVADWKGEPQGAFNIRENSGCAGRQSTENVRIESKTDQPGIDIIVKKNTKNEKIYIPALVTHSDVTDLVYNDFYIGKNADVTIVAGCGVHSDGCGTAEHDGIHRFFLEKGARVLYLEKHIGIGEGDGQRIINPQTYIEADENSYMEMETTQIEGVDSTKRFSKAVLQDGAKLVIKEKIMTHGSQYAETSFEVDLNGTDSSAHLISRSVAKDSSKQLFLSKVNGNAKCAGHSECDAIIMGDGSVSAIPEISANCVDAALIHEAAIGKIAGEQLVKLMTLGLTEKEAENRIVEGFLE